MLLYLRKIFTVIGIGIFFTFLIVHAVLGSYSRFMADDYCSAALTNSKGVLGGTLQWYKIWSGRFSANFFDSLMGYLGPRFTPYSSAIVIAIWIVILFLVLHFLSHAFNKQTRLLDKILLSAVILSSSFIITPNLSQSLYWGQGMRSVIPPLILGTAFIGFIQYQSMNNKKLTWRWLFAAGVISLVAGGFSETYVVLQTSALTLSSLLFFAYIRDSQKLDLDNSAVYRNILVLLAIGLLFSIISMLIVIIAPGNIARQTHFPPPPSFLKLARIAFKSMADYIKKIVFSPTKLLSTAGVIGYSIILGSGAVINSKLKDISRQVNIIVIHWLPIILFLLLYACFIPAAFGMSSGPPSRTLIIPTYVLICGLSFWGFYLGKYTQTLKSFLGTRTRFIPLFKLAGLFVFLLFNLVTLRETKIAIQDQPQYVSYALAWDKVDQSIRLSKKEGLDSITVMPVPNFAGLNDIEEDSEHWVNKCVSNYYGIEVKVDQSLNE